MASLSETALTALLAPPNLLVLSHFPVNRGASDSAAHELQCLRSDPRAKTS